MTDTSHQAAQARIDLWTREIAAEPVDVPRQAMEDEDQDYVDLFAWGATEKRSGAGEIVQQGQ